MLGIYAIKRYDLQDRKSWHNLQRVYEQNYDNCQTIFKKKSDNLINACSLERMFVQPKPIYVCKTVTMINKKYT
jgi:hypothetical protein